MSQGGDIDKEDKSSIVHCGSYKKSWVLPGMYFLEVLIIHCNDFGVNALSMGHNSTTSQSYDYRHECMEDPGRGRITADGATVAIGNEVHGVGDSSKGHWRYHTEAISSTTMQPLVTRYQPQGCRDSNQTLERCERVMKKTHHDSFSFVFRKYYDGSLEGKLLPFFANIILEPEIMSEIEKTFTDDIHPGDGQTVIVKAVNQLQEKLTAYDPSFKTRDKVCIVGASHSYHLAHALWRSNLGHNFFFTGFLKSPEALTADYFSKYRREQNCTTFVVAVGQWIASWAWLLTAPGGPWTMEKWKIEMTRIAQIFTTTSGGSEDKEHENTQLYFRSIHRNPIGDWISSCPPQDWRSTTVIDGYNFVLEKIVSGSNHPRVHLIDTRFITEPLWDATYDWCHLAPRVSQVEAIYIASKVLG